MIFTLLATVNTPYKLEAPVTDKLLNEPPAPKETLELGPKTTSLLKVAVPEKVLAAKKVLLEFLNATSITEPVPFINKS